MTALIAGSQFQRHPIARAPRLLSFPCVFPLFNSCIHTLALTALQSVFLTRLLNCVQQNLHHNAFNTAVERTGSPLPPLLILAALLGPR